jgi:6-phosphogluconolactonase (cycloisomerase 2 family)
LTGSFPRDFAFVPGSNLLLVGHKRSNEVAVYAFDPATGVITRRDGTYAVHRPTCIVFG